MFSPMGLCVERACPTIGTLTNVLAPHSVLLPQESFLMCAFHGIQHNQKSAARSASTRCDSEDPGQPLRRATEVEGIILTLPRTLLTSGSKTGQPILGPPVQRSKRTVSHKRVTSLLSRARCPTGRWRTRFDGGKQRYHSPPHSSLSWLRRSTSVTVNIETPSISGTSPAGVIVDSFLSGTSQGSHDHPPDA